MLSPPPPSLSIFPIHMHPSTFNCHTHRDFFRFYRKACANKVFSCDLNWDSVGTFLRVAGREFQRDGAMKLKERCPNDLRFCFGILSLHVDFYRVHTYILHQNVQTFPNLTDHFPRLSYCSVTHKIKTFKFQVKSTVHFLHVDFYQVHTWFLL